MEEIRKKAKKIIYLTAEEMRDLIRDMSGIWYAVEYGISYVRKLLRSWGFTRKVPMGRHVRRANRQKIAWFRKKLRPLIEEKRNGGYAICVQDEAIVVADARLRGGVYTPKGMRAVYTYTGSHAKTIVFGLITADGNGFFKRYDRFTRDEFADFLKEAHQRFGKILMIVDGAPQHKAQIVKETVKDLDGLELKFLPPGYPEVLLRYRDLPKITDNILDRFRIVMVHLECGSARWNHGHPKSDCASTVNLRPPVRCHRIPGQVMENCRIPC